MGEATHIEPDLQQAVFDILDADVPLRTLLGGAGRILDFVKDGQALPYVTVGDSTMGDWSTHDTDGFEGSFTVSVWAEARGKTKAKDIQKLIWGLIHNKALGIAGRTQINLRCGLQTVLREDDGRTHQGIQRFDFIFGGNE